jgi:hypothetical protein
MRRHSLQLRLNHLCSMTVQQSLTVQHSACVCLLMQMKPGRAPPGLALAAAPTPPPAQRDNRLQLVQRWGM